MYTRGMWSFQSQLGSESSASSPYTHTGSVTLPICRLVLVWMAESTLNILFPHSQVEHLARLVEHIALSWTRTGKIRCALLLWIVVFSSAAQPKKTSTISSSLQSIGDNLFMYLSVWAKRASFGNWLPVYFIQFFFYLPRCLSAVVKWFDCC